MTARDATHVILDLDGTLINTGAPLQSSSLISSGRTMTPRRKCRHVSSASVSSSRRTRSPAVPSSSSYLLLLPPEQLVDEVVSAIVHDLADRDPKAVRDALERVRGMRPRDGSERLIDLLQLTDPKTSARASADALLALTEAKLNARWGEVALMPGASRLLRFLADAEIPVALATSTPAKYLAAKMASHAGAFIMFTLVPVRPRRRGARRTLRSLSPGARFSPPNTPRFQSRHTSAPFNSI
jgi:beta-phosphoglucomutase-like phosphatase (HAD superfamily)